MTSCALQVADRLDRPSMGFNKPVRQQGHADRSTFDNEAIKRVDQGAPSLRRRPATQPPASLARATLASLLVASPRLSIRTRFPPTQHLTLSTRAQRI